MKPGSLPRIGRIPFLNAAPFYAGLADRGWPLLTLPPRQLGEAGRRGEVDAAPFSLLDAEKLGTGFRPLGDLIIGVKSVAGSVILFSRMPAEELSRATDLSLPPDSTTSAVLARVILKERFGAVPFPTRSAGDADARLLIGDAALAARRRGLPGYPHFLDLGQAWWEWQRLPFVFARWMVGTGVPCATADEILRLAQSSLKDWFGDPVSAGRYAPWIKELGLPADALEEYLQGFVYVRGEAEAESMRRFLKLAADAGDNDV